MQVSSLRWSWKSTLEDRSTSQTSKSQQVFTSPTNEKNRETKQDRTGVQDFSACTPTLSDQHSLQDG